jgi:hypothetical protein
MKTSILNFPEDNILNILQNVDVVSFIYFLSTCKQFYNMRKVYIKFISEVQKYKEYDQSSNLINVLLKSFINIEKMHNDIIYIDNKDITIDNKDITIDEQKIKNTFNIFGYYCTQNINNILTCYDYYEYLSKMYCKAVCQKYNYKYKHLNYINKIYDLKWYIININIFELYDIAYHIKMKKYKDLNNILLSLKFKDNQLYIMETITFLVRCFEYKINVKFNVILIYILYSYIDINIEKVMIYTNFKNVIINKASEFCNSINNKKLNLPKYIKTLITNKLENTVIKLQ